jgi:hypothetical protein
MQILDTMEHDHTHNQHILKDMVESLAQFLSTTAVHMTGHTVILRVRKISILEVPDLAIKNIVEIDILNMVIQAMVKMIIEVLLILIYLLPIQKKLVAAIQVAMGILHH